MLKHSAKYYHGAINRYVEVADLSVPIGVSVSCKWPHIRMKALCDGRGALWIPGSSRTHSLSTPQIYRPNFKVPIWKAKSIEAAQLRKLV